jgi:uncharacterized membrane protein
MPRSATESVQDTQAGQGLAIAAESLYVANLLILPLFAFLALLLLYLKHNGKAPPLAQSHLEQTVRAGIGIALMFMTAAAIVVLLRMQGMEDMNLWMIVVLAFTIMHASMVLLGVVGLARAMAGKCWRYPLFGKALPRDCPY